MIRDVVITGIGAVTPLGVGAAVLHRRWAAGESGIVDGVGSCADFDPSAFLSAREQRRMDRFAQLAVVAADEALDEAGWEAEPPCDPGRVSCVIGSSVGGMRTMERQVDVRRTAGPGAVSPLTVPMMMANAAAAHVALRRRLRGESHCVMSACASGAQAIGSGLRTLLTGEADAAVVGGADAATTEFCGTAFLNSGARSPTGRSRPFHATRDGFVNGEGAGILVLETAELAQRRGARVLGRLLGYGSSTDAFHITAPEPEGRAAAEALRRALASAGLLPEQIDYVNAHGTGTELNDRAETLAITATLGEPARRIPISSTKSTIGHLVGAAGAVEAVATAMVLRERLAPPNVGLDQIDERLPELDYVVGEARPLPDGGRPLAALSNSFGFGGHNAVLALGTA